MGMLKGWKEAQAHGAHLLQSPQYPYLMQDSLTNYTQGPQVHQRATVSGLKALYDLTPA